MKAVIFDLDGVLVSTDELHYQAWLQIARSEGISFDRTLNDRLRGVSRMQSLEIILERAGHGYAQKEKEALDRGVSVEQLKQMRRVERENAELRRSIQESRRREEADRVYAGWVKEAEDLKEIYPAFNLETEVQDQRFTDLLRNNIDLRTAYEVVHRDEILGGAMQYTARQVSEKLVNDIKAKGSRPTENGVSAQSAAVVGRTDCFLTPVIRGGPKKG